MLNTISPSRNIQQDVLDLVPAVSQIKKRAVVEQNAVASAASFLFQADVDQSIRYPLQPFFSFSQGLSALNLESKIKFFLENSYSPEWEFVKPMPVALEYDQESDQYMVSDEIFSEYGLGDTVEDAKKDYAENLHSYYVFLQERAVEDTETRQAFETICEYIVPANR